MKYYDILRGLKVAESGVLKLKSKSELKNIELSNKLINFCLNCTKIKCVEDRHTHTGCNELKNYKLKIIKESKNEKF